MRTVAFAAFVLAATMLHAQPTAPRARLVEELRLDANKEDFSTVSRVYVGPHGQIAVPLAQDRQIRLYDSTGRSLGRVGQRGQGPGEFTFLGNMGWVGDTLWVHDFELRRITYIAPNATVLRTVAISEAMMMPPAGIGTAGQRMMIFSPTAVHSDASLLAEGMLNAQASGRGWPERIVVRTPPDGKAQLVARMPRYEDDRWYMTVEGFGNTVPFMLTPKTAYAFDGSRLAYLWAEFTSKESGRFVISSIRARGDTAFTRSYPFTGTPIPQRSLDSAAAAFLPKPGQGTEGPSDLGQRFQAMAKQKMPSVYTPVSAIQTGLDNTIWLTMRPTEEGRVTLMLNERGDPTLSVLTKATTVVRQARADRIWVTETDEDGLSSVVRYRVIRYAAGGSN